MNIGERQVAHRRVETEILGPSIQDTFRTPARYATHLGYKDVTTFLREIAGKDICDMASGTGGLFTKLKLIGSTARVISVNPRVGLPTYIKSTDYSAEENWRMREELSSYPEGHISTLRHQYDTTANRSFAHNISLRAESFDLVFDNFGVSYYMKEKNKLALEDSIREMMRILRPGGELRIGDEQDYFHPGYGDIPMSFKEQILRDLNLNYEYLYADHDPNKIIGVVIKKKQTP